MTTALDMLKRSMRLIGVIGIGETPEAEEAEDGLAALNGLVNSISNNRLLINALALDSFALTSGDAIYTVGPAGDIATTRPMRVDDSSYIEKGGLTYNLKQIDGDEYNGIGDKGAQGDTPEYFWYRGDYPAGTLTFYPVPGTGCTLKLWSWKALATFPTLTTQASLPPGYEDMLVFNLAVVLAPEYQTEVPREVSRQAMLTKKRVKRTNTVAPTMSLPAAVTSMRYPARIESDT
jgi:hypothetical protein